jgi:pantoate--beta-alanine ligase
MEVFYTSKELKSRLSEIRTQGRSVGFVPTMGSLHSGHASLLHLAKSQSDAVVLSIYVNPTQFNNPDDFASYPHMLQDDLELAQLLEVDLVFVPETKDLYEGVPSAMPVDYGRLTHSFEGAKRQGHFDGVVAIVRKLFQIVQPSRAFFGEKDLQQLAVIRELARREFEDLEIVPCALIRDKDGLALSSRNVRLSPVERTVALQLNRSLMRLKMAAAKGLGGVLALNTEQLQLKNTPGIDLEYLDVIDPETFQTAEPDRWSQGHAVLAVNLGSVRLIDNLFLGE